MTARDEAVARLLAFARDAELEAEPGGRPGEVVLVLPGEKKLKTVLSLVVGERDVSASAFVVRNPDENHEAVYRFLLRRNLRTPGLAYAIDAVGDVYVVGRLPLAALDDAALDSLLGVVLDAADSVFNELLTLGFLTSIKREWAWRTSRGESKRNLEAFAHLMDADDTPPVDASPVDPSPHDTRPHDPRPDDPERRTGEPAEASPHTTGETDGTDGPAGDRPTP